MGEKDQESSVSIICNSLFKVILRSECHGCAHTHTHTHWDLSIMGVLTHTHWDQSIMGVLTHIKIRVSWVCSHTRMRCKHLGVLTYMHWDQSIMDVLRTDIRASWVCSRTRIEIRASWVSSPHSLNSEQNQAQRGLFTTSNTAHSELEKASVQIVMEKIYRRGKELCFDHVFDWQALWTLPHFFYHEFHYIWREKILKASDIILFINLIVSEWFPFFFYLYKIFLL